MNDEALSRELFICECENTEHQLIFAYFQNKDLEEVYMDVHLVPEYCIWKRIWNAIKYIFGYRSKYGHFDSFIFQKCDAPKLAKIVKYLDPEVFSKCSEQHVSVLQTESSSNS